MAEKILRIPVPPELARPGDWARAVTTGGWREVDSMDEHFVYLKANGKIIGPFATNSCLFERELSVDENLSPAELPCPNCNAGPGSYCTQPTDNGRRIVDWFHAAREDLLA